MQMTDLMKRLAELDSKNPNVAKESRQYPDGPEGPDSVAIRNDDGSLGGSDALGLAQDAHEDDPSRRPTDDEYEHIANHAKKIKIKLTGVGVSNMTGHLNYQGIDANGERVEGMLPPLKKISDHGMEDNPNKYRYDAMPHPHDMGKDFVGFEGKNLAECDEPGMSNSQNQASINMTAGTGEEVASMLDAIMKLAGVKTVDTPDLGIEHEPAVMSAEPTIAVGPAIGDRDDMRSVLDRLNSADDDEFIDDETDEGSYSNTPASPYPKKAFDSNEFAHQENQPGAGNRMDGTMPKGQATFEDTLMAEYKKFVAEDSVEDYLKAGGKIKHGKPQKGPKRPGLTLGSKHIGNARGAGKAGSISGRKANIGKKTRPVVAVEGEEQPNPEFNEGLSPGEYHLWTVHFDDGTTGKIRITWDETSDEDIKAFYAKKGKTVVKIDYDWAVHGGDNMPVTPEPYEKEQPRNPYATRKGPDSDFM